ncbi:SpoIIE family protein phosphatase [Streptomyces sp. NPDC058405]|uniref:ATP-binding SpoIIE family protein phosphatase n=1 Tax=Streptomyces sp. NPDC058405 TaxID=3346482 RepID=UPI00365B3494
MPSRTATVQAPITSQKLFRASQELAEAAVPELADASSVDVLEVLLRGDAPPPGPVDADMRLRRAAFHSAHSARGGGVRSPYAVGDVSRIPPATPCRRSLIDLRPRLIRDLDHDSRWLARYPTPARLLREAGAHSLIVLPLTVRGVALGLAVLYRRADSAPFEEEDLHAAAKLADRAARCLDTIRRHIQEHALARLLQRSLLPEEIPPVSALDAAHGDAAAEGSAGQWFDVLPLSSARVALVVGRAEGKGVHAVTGMNRLRASITTLAPFDLRPDELLAHLDDVVIRLADQHPRDQKQIGAGCLYVVHDPVTGHCTASRAGTAFLMTAQPDGTVSAPRLASHQPLGVESRPFEITEFDVPPGSTLFLRSDGPDGPHAALDPFTQQLREAMTRCGPDVREVLAHVARAPSPGRDPAVLIARTRALEAGNVATRNLLPDPAAVSVARTWTSRQLATWMLDELAFTTTLVVSELVTNAIRYSAGPVGLRLIRDERTLICEVSDSSSAGPRRCQPMVSDEGGRGLSIVTQLTQHQGTRFTDSGKTVWAEQSLPT